MQKRLDRELDWTHLRAFVVTAETGSYSAAARQLGLTQPTLGRQVTALEEDLGLALFERKGRGLHLTEAGADLLPAAQDMQDAARRLSMLAEGRANDLEGRVRVTASDLFSARTLPGYLTRLRQMAPKLRIDIVATNDISDILAREADIAIRHVRPVEPDLIARFVLDAPAHLYASRAYVEARGMPETLADLAQHDFIGMGEDSAMSAGLAAYGLTIAPQQFVTAANSSVAVWALVREGFGVFPMADAIAEGDPDIVRLLDGVADMSFPVWLVTHRDLHTSRRIRLVFDFLYETLKDALAGG